MFGSAAPPPGSSASGGFGAPSQAAFGGGQPQPSLFGQPQQSSSLFGAPGAAAVATPSLFGQPTVAAPTPSVLGKATPSLFGQPQPAPAASAFGQSSSPLSGGYFGQPAAAAASTPSLFGQGPSPSLFGQAQPSLFASPAPAQQQQQQQQPGMFGSLQPTTQMVPVAPLTMPLPDRELQGIVDAYNEDASNPRYLFRHLFLSVTEPGSRVKPSVVSDLMWAEAMSKLEDSTGPEKNLLWPELAQGFKDLLRRMQARMRATAANAAGLRRHFETDTLPWIQRLRLQEQALSAGCSGFILQIDCNSDYDDVVRFISMMRIVEALEQKGQRVPLAGSEVQLAKKLRQLAGEVRGPHAELPRRVEALLSAARLKGSIQTGALPPADGLLDELSLAEMQEALQQQTEAIVRLTAVLKRDARDVETMLGREAGSSVALGEHPESELVICAPAGLGILAAHKLQHLAPEGLGQPDTLLQNKVSGARTQEPHACLQLPLQLSWAPACTSQQ
eukprot:SM000301S11774  [mRNA]  locus=s301:90564:93430:- [translate_table: standard]